MSPAELETMVSTQANVGMEAYYWWCTALMVIIHCGFLLYEVGATRMKNAVSSGVKNLLAFAFMIPTFWLFGWYIYLAFPNGFVPIDLEGYGVPWNTSMGPMLSDQATGVFWAAFTLFACTTASIFSGSVIERIRISSFSFLAIILGSVVWILGASWGWHPDGWLVTTFGLHDVAAAGCVHTVAGWYAFGVLLNLGPRVGKFNADGTMNELDGHNLIFSFVGLLFLIVGFFGFLGACLIWAGTDFGGWVNIYGSPANLSAFAFNTLMGLSGGMIGGYLVSKGNPFWMMSGGLAGIFSCAAALDILYPGLAFVLGFVGGCIIIPAHNWLAKTFKIDDCVGAVSVHGVAGLWGLLACGIFASGFPASGDIPASNLLGQIVGMITFFLLGFVPGYVISWIMNKLNWLRIPDHVQEAGLDKEELSLKAYYD
ncbi:MAG: Ammonium transporter NrgA [Alphaproteobacteria bacterium MarineAlpha5_Bin9]|nr:MAG: Ammonium transporter NrgA [Alphaproteobacteria bacterium MarineAlpha5_Bin9]|tara:strand:+ start:3632 stop:4912 length:1281 start_codon:yes stop_codon:yes gene_type:complete